MNINSELQQSYYGLLSGHVTISLIPGVSQVVPFFSYGIPAGAEPDYYFYINTIMSSGYKDDVTKFNLTSVQIMIVTKVFQNNSGDIANNIAGQIEAIIYPGTIAIPVTIASGIVQTTEKKNDNVMAGLTDGTKKIVNRIITFQHKIQFN